MPISPNTLSAVARFVIDRSDFNHLPPDLITISKEMMVNAAAVGLAGAAQGRGADGNRGLPRIWAATAGVPSSARGCGLRRCTRLWSTAY